MKMPDYLAKDVVDTREGDYYVTVVDGERVGFLAGPYRLHVNALACVDKARTIAIGIDRRAWFYAFGTCRIEHAEGNPVGKLNLEIGIPLEDGNWSDHLPEWMGK